MAVVLCAASVVAQCADNRYDLQHDTDLPELFALVPRSGDPAVNLSHVLSYVVPGPVKVYELHNDHLSDLNTMLSTMRASNTKKPEELLFPVPENELVLFNTDLVSPILQHIRFQKLPSREIYILVRGNHFSTAYSRLTPEQREHVDMRIARLELGDIGASHSITKAKDIKNSFCELQINGGKLRVYYIIIDNKYAGLIFVGDKEMPAQRNDIKQADQCVDDVKRQINDLKMRRSAVLNQLMCVEDASE